MSNLNRIRELRKERGMKQGELARAAEISQPYLYDLELGRRGAHRLTWERIAKALGCTVEELQGNDTKEDTSNDDGNMHNAERDVS